MGSAPGANDSIGWFQRLDGFSDASIFGWRSEGWYVVSEDRSRPLEPAFVLKLGRFRSARRCIPRNWSGYVRDSTIDLRNSLSARHSKGIDWSVPRIQVSRRLREQSFLTTEDRCVDNMVPAAKQLENRRSRFDGDPRSWRIGGAYAELGSTAAASPLPASGRATACG
jgi:hypothetical protein